MERKDCISQREESCGPSTHCRHSSGIQESHQHKSQIRLIQTNVNYCQGAQDLLSQTIREKDIDVAIVGHIEITMTTFGSKTKWARQPYRIAENQPSGK